MTAALSDAQINDGLAKLKDWARVGDELTKEFRFDQLSRRLGFRHQRRGDRRGPGSSPGPANRLAARERVLHDA